MNKDDDLLIYDEATISDQKIKNKLSELAEDLRSINMTQSTRVNFADIPPRVRDNRNYNLNNRDIVIANKCNDIGKTAEVAVKNIYNTAQRFKSSELIMDHGSNLDCRVREDLSTVIKTDCYIYDTSKKDIHLTGEVKATSYKKYMRNNTFGYANENFKSLFKYIDGIDFILLCHVNPYNTFSNVHLKYLVDASKFKQYIITDNNLSKHDDRIFDHRAAIKNNDAWKLF